MKNKKRNFIIITLLILTISVGYAILSSTLNIGGKVGYSASSWDVYFDNIQVYPESINKDPPVIANKTTINYNLIFKEPGEIYEFSVDVVNNGTMDVMLDSIVNTELTEEQLKYLTINISYLGGSSINKYDLLPSKTKAKIVIKVTYNYNISEIPQNIETTLSTSLTYLLANEKATNPYGVVWDFDYTGAEEEFQINYPGTYLVETWGAQGYSVDDLYVGGYGAYAAGSVQLKNKNKLYLTIGESGVGGISTGYNSFSNGGSGYGGAGTHYGGSGGGSSHIIFNTGSLASFENSKDDILIVAAGGGSSTKYRYWSCGGGSGGGIQGETAGSRGLQEGQHYSAGTGGTQSSGGTKGNHGNNGLFGQGGNGASDTATSIAGGGGGYYGGGTSFGCGGGGGSSYIGNPLLSNKVMYCYKCQESAEESTKTISTTVVSEIPISQCAKKGNGYARITYIR